MKEKQLESWSWILIYGGLLGASLGWFLRSSTSVLAWTLMGAGAVVVAVGAAMIVVRARMRP